MEVKIYKADNMKYTLFADKTNDCLFGKYGIKFTNKVNDCDIVLSRFFFILENYIKFHGNQKKYLLWTHEPRIDMHLDSIIFSDNVPINVMNVYTGDIFTNNYLYANCLKQELMQSIKLSFDRPRHKKVAVIASYNQQYFSQVTEDGRNFDLCAIRAEITLFGNSLDKVDIYGQGSSNNISLEDSTFQLKSTEQFWGDRKLDILQNYHFNLCFENSTINYYCSEKIWHSILTGCLPIYYGEGNAIYEDFPRQSFLDYCDFNSPQKLFNYIDAMKIDEYNQRMNLCIQTVNKVINQNGYIKATQKLIHNTISKIQTIADFKKADDDLIKCIISESDFSLNKNVALNKPAQQSSICKYSKPNDSQGAVSGIRSGRYNFHTDREVNPWWQVDLEQIYIVSEIIIYNRLDSCRERASSLKLFISSNEKIWEQAYENNPENIFGGIDGNPLVIPIDNRQARYIRIQLNAIEVLHLDQVEVYAA
jgi:hypothetical protein